MSNETENTIEVTTLCRHYKVEHTLFTHLDDMGLIHTITIKDTLYIDEAEIRQIDKIIRLYRELNINPEGIDVVLNLLEKIEDLEQKLTSTRNRLNIYEN